MYPGLGRWFGGEDADHRGENGASLAALLSKMGGRDRKTQEVGEPASLLNVVAKKKTWSLNRRVEERRHKRLSSETHAQTHSHELTQHTSTRRQ